MPTKLSDFKSLRGQTLIGLIIAIAVFALLGSAIFTLASSSYSFVGYSRSRIAARHLAQQQIEVIRNMAYEDVGTVGGIPSGTLAQTQNIVRNGLNYVVTTSVVYIDDPFDGLSPSDLLPTDYKSVRVAVNWEGATNSGIEPVVLATNIVPAGTETTTGGGTLSIVVFDANAQPINQASVHIVANTTTPQVDLTLQTNANGRIVLPGAPVCTGCYQITVQKSGYSLERTYSSSEIANPAKPYQSVIQNQVTEISFAIDKLATLHVTSHDSRENGFTLLPNTDFNLRGSKILGTDVNDDPIYKFDQDFATDSTGNLTITDVEWDSYTLTIPSGTTHLSGSSPISPFVILPEESASLAFTLESSGGSNLLLAFVDENAQPLASVSATLTNIPTYGQTKLSGSEINPDFGQVFFPDLTNTSYQLVATLAGYVDHNENITVLNKTKIQVSLTPQ